MNEPIIKLLEWLCFNSEKVKCISILHCFTKSFLTLHLHLELFLCLHCCNTTCIWHSFISQPSHDSVLSQCHATSSIPLSESIIAKRYLDRRCNYLLTRVEEGIFIWICQTRLVHQGEGLNKKPLTFSYSGNKDNMHNPIRVCFFFTRQYGVLLGSFGTCQSIISAVTCICWIHYWLRIGFCVCESFTIVFFIIALLRDKTQENSTGKV